MLIYKGLNCVQRSRKDLAVVSQTSQTLVLMHYESKCYAFAYSHKMMPTFQGGTFRKLAVLTSHTKALAQRVSDSGGTKGGSGGDVLFAGEVPGIGTKVGHCFLPVRFQVVSASRSCRVPCTSGDRTSAPKGKCWTFGE